MLKEAAQKISCGQILLIGCCVVYLVWWSLSFRPGQTVNRVGGYRGILLLATALLGFAGAILTMRGVTAVPASAEPWRGKVLCAAGIAAYILLLGITGYGLKRPVTTELILIVGWTVLELCAVNALAGAGVLPGGCLAAMSVMIAMASVGSLILYVLYYRMEAWRAFYLAMVPLVTEGISMAVLEILSFPGLRAF